MCCSTRPSRFRMSLKMINTRAPIRLKMAARTTAMIVYGSDAVAASMYHRTPTFQATAGPSPTSGRAPAYAELALTVTSVFWNSPNATGSGIHTRWEVPSLNSTR